MGSILAVYFKTVLTSGTDNVVLSFSSWKAKNRLASGAFTVDVCFSVANAVALKAEKSREALRKPQKIGILLAPFVEIF